MASLHSQCEQPQVRSMHFNVKENYWIQLPDKSDEAEVVNSICLSSGHKVSPAHLHNTDHFPHGHRPGRHCYWRGKWL